jgi:hypothetical protein
MQGHPLVFLHFLEFPDCDPTDMLIANDYVILKLVVCILLRVLGQVEGCRLTQHCFEYFIQ